ncbi:MAG TPA: four helix bundle protein [Chryseosolibacter sp.]
MSKIQRFEDLRCWQSARLLVKHAFVVCERGKLSKDYETRAQFKKAALSTMNNIAEGFGRFHKNDSLRFYDFSQSSALELQSMTYTLADVGYISEEEAFSLRTKAEETKNLTLGLVKHINNRNSKSIE